MSELAPMNFKSRVPKWLLPGGIGFVVGILSMVVVLFGAFLLDGAFPPRYTFPFPPGQKLDEPAAVEATRKGLEAMSVDLSGATPVRFYPDNPEVFAVNQLAPDTGYVLWKVPSRRTGLLWDFLVQVERKGTNLTVAIHKPH